MHGEHERRGQRGEEQIRAREVPPLAIAVPPSHRQLGVDPLADRVPLPVPQDGEVWQESDVQERGRDREVR